MRRDHEAQYVTEAPLLPRPLPGAVLRDLGQLRQTPEEVEEQRVQISALRGQVSTAIETIQRALADNHAEYVEGRASWPYRTTNEITYRLRILKRQRQYLQDAYGACGTWLKRWYHEHPSPARQERSVPHPRALAFVRAAEELLDKEKVSMLWELVDSQGGNGDGTEA